jgi:hypothetical protein
MEVFAPPPQKKTDLLTGMPLATSSSVYLCIWICGQMEVFCSPPPPQKKTDSLAGMLSISYHLNVTLIIFDANQCWSKGRGGGAGRGGGEERGRGGEGWQWGLDSVVGSWMVGSKFFLFLKSM